jgi:hypothetical protein
MAKKRGDDRNGKLTMARIASNSPRVHQAAQEKVRYLSGPSLDTVI